jgi:4-amino-4-deoxy-L-arabinose transferase-like glycosyltransferase
VAAQAGDPVTDNPKRLSGREFTALLLGIAAVALFVRGIYPAADPPWKPPVGIVWHDEGAWVHNARNRVLFGTWITDAWNPMYVAPVFTGLEYLVFAALGVGVRQARLVSEITGFLSVILLAFGVRRIAGREAGVIAGALLATNYVYVMYNRAAIMEASMVAFLVAAWYCYVRAHSSAWWGCGAALCAMLAYFTKAAAAFFVAALAIDAVLVLLRRSALGGSESRRAAMATLAGLAVCIVAALVIFILPNWTEYRFYNWQMSVTRKPSYDLKSLLDRITWFPILHDVFTRMWFTVIVATAGMLGAIVRWRRIEAGQRLLVLWITLGVLELLLHDVGNERRFVILIPALVALTAIVLARDRTILPPELEAVPRARAIVALPLVLFALYVVFGAIVRLAFMYEIRPNVRLALVMALAGTALIYASWPWLPRRLGVDHWTPGAGLLVAMLVSGGQLAQFLQWAGGHTSKNYRASLELGRVLPPDTLVHGKLANGLALENRIRPVFVGRGFGNYEDRKRRDDVRYILTYIAPSLGYESQASNPVIKEVLDAYPNRRTIMTFELAETTTGYDRAALIDKFGGITANTAPETTRAQDR